MKSYSRQIKTTASAIASILAGFCLFLLITVLLFNTILLTPEYHQSLFEKHRLTEHIHTVINNSLAEFRTSMEKNSSDATRPFADVLAELESSLTLPLVETNLTSLREGLFAYFKGDRRFLPDLILNAGGGSDGQTAKAAEKASSPTVQIPKIEKINLSAILLYTNRSEITDRVAQLRLLFYSLHKLPDFLLPVLIVLAAAAFACIRNTREAGRCLRLSLMTGGFLSLAAGAVTAYAAYFVVPHGLSPLVMSLPLQNEVIHAYVQDCLLHSIVFLLAGGSVLLAVSLPAGALVRITASGIGKASRYFPPIVIERRQLIKYCSMVLLLVVSSMLFVQQLQFVAIDSSLYDFHNTLLKLRSSSAVTQVVAAGDDTIYTLQLQLFDNKAQAPLKGVTLHMSGRSKTAGRYYEENVTTDSEGIAKLTLDQGAYRIAFRPGQPADRYILPSPFFTELKSAGTTIITINLDPKPEEKAKDPGIIEIELLDASNKPVAGTELTVDKNGLEQDMPVQLLSRTNTDGIAVFKLNEGTYTINFSSTGFPGSYLLPAPIEAFSRSGETTRYTIQAARKKK